MPQFSVFTPTHEPRFLGRLAASLRAQTEQDFEWLVMPNGGARLDGLPLPQARIVEPPASANIGALKGACCAYAAGDILVEADHDDELTEDCLDALAEAFDDPAVDFAYSNFAELRAEKPVAYEARFGWESRPFSYQGRELIEMVAFPPEPAAFSRIHFAPNHVRAWRRSFYEKIGGHDATMAVLDDQELLCRTFLHAQKIRHIDRCLYLYHYTGENTSKGERNREIQKGTQWLHDRFIYPMVEAWSRQQGLRLIDLCGAHDCPAGYESCDIDPAGDVVADLNERWPFADGEVGVFRAHDALEHLRDPRHSMREAWRCLAPKGWLLSNTPSTDGRGAFQDPTHCSFWNANSFWYYTRAQQAKYIGTPARFQAVRIFDWQPTEWHKTNQIWYVKADLHKFSGRTPGLLEF